MELFAASGSIAYSKMNMRRTETFGWWQRSCLTLGLLTMLFGLLFAAIMPDPQRTPLVTDTSIERDLLFQSLLTEQPSRIPVRRNRSANICSGRKSEVSSVVGTIILSCWYPSVIHFSGYFIFSDRTTPNSLSVTVMIDYKRNTCHRLMVALFSCSSNIRLGRPRVPTAMIFGLDCCNVRLCVSRQPKACGTPFILILLRLRFR